MPYSRRAITRRCRVGICAPAYIAGAIATRSSCNFFVVMAGASSHCAIVGRVCSNRSYRPRQLCRLRGLSGDALVLPPRPAMPCCPKTQEAIRGGNAIRCFCSRRRRAGFATLRDVLLRFAHSLKRSSGSSFQSASSFCRVDAARAFGRLSVTGHPVAPDTGGCSNDSLESPAVMSMVSEAIRMRNFVHAEMSLKQILL
jgi:hypothetical protein